MNTPRLAVAMDYIDEALISGATEYMPTHSTKANRLWKPFLAAAACMMFVIGIGIALFNYEPSHQVVDNPSIAPAHFYYGGNCYHYAGDLVYTLPEGCELLGEVNNVGDSFTGIDMDGNVDGYIFADKSDASVFYFQWKEWNEAVDGREPFLILMMDEES